MKVVTHSCPIVEVAMEDGRKVFDVLWKKWPMGTDLESEHICYGLVFGLVMLYEEQINESLSIEEFADFVKDLLIAHM